MYVIWVSTLSSIVCQEVHCWAAAVRARRLARLPLCVLCVCERVTISFLSGFDVYSRRLRAICLLLCDFVVVFVFAPKMCIGAQWLCELRRSVLSRRALRVSLRMYPFLECF